MTENHGVSNTNSVVWLTEQRRDWHGIPRSQVCLAAVVAAVVAMLDGIQRYATERLPCTKLLQTQGFWLSNALSQLGFIRIVAPNVAGSSPVGHPYVFLLILGKREASGTVAGVFVSSRD